MRKDYSSNEWREIFMKQSVTNTDKLTSAIIVYLSVYLSDLSKQG